MRSFPLASLSWWISAAMGAKSRPSPFRKWAQLVHPCAGCGAGRITG
jgi:hypothetical protein